MDEQSSAVAPAAKPKSGLAKIIIINAIVSGLVAAVVTLAITASLNGRLAAAETTLKKITAAYRVQ